MGCCLEIRVAVTSGNRRCRIVRSGRRCASRVGKTSEHGYLWFDNPSGCFLPSLSLHSTPFRFWLVRAHSNTHLPSQCRLTHPGGPCCRSKRTSPCALFLNRCSEIDRAVPRLFPTHFHYPFFNPFFSFHYDFGAARSPSVSPRAKAIRLASVEPIHPRPYSSYPGSAQSR